MDWLGFESDRLGSWGIGAFGCDRLLGLSQSCSKEFVLSRYFVLPKNLLAGVPLF